MNETRWDMAKTGIFQVQDEEVFFGTLVSLAQKNQFRTAWNHLRNNVDPEHTRVYDAGVILQNLSNEYGDIGTIKDECLLKKNLNNQVDKVVKLLM